MIEARKLYEEANRRYWDELESLPIPRWMPFSYDMVYKVEKGNWPMLGSMMVSDELNEIINLMNAWGSHLFSWSTWAKILPTFCDEDRWTLQMECVDPFAFICMYQPSAMRDRFCMIATNSTHQANLAALPEYKDRLEQDEKHSFQRSVKEKRLANLGCKWANFNNFYKCLQEIDTPDYRQITSNFRNYSSHAIAPRFGIGVTNTVTRYMTPSQKMVEQPDGTFILKDTEQKAVAYSFGGTPPLEYGEMVAANQKQYHLAASALNAYETLLLEQLQKIGSR